MWRQSKERKAWQNMMARCYSTEVRSYADYGGRGITVCAKWRKSFPAFLKDVGRAPSPNLTIGRIDNNGDYEPGNVAWQTTWEQARNRRANRIVVYRGREMILTDAARLAGLDLRVVWTRLRKGDSVEDAFLSIKGYRAKIRPTHCKHGHEFTRANTGVRPDTGARQCRKCNRERVRVILRLQRGWTAKDSSSKPPLRRGPIPLS